MLTVWYILVLEIRTASMLSFDNECDKTSLDSTLHPVASSVSFIILLISLVNIQISVWQENNWESAFSFGCQGCEGNILESELNLDNIINNIILSNGINIVSVFLWLQTE